MKQAENMSQPEGISCSLQWVSNIDCLLSRGNSYELPCYPYVMKKPITVKAHLSLEEVEARSRKAKDAVERSHWQIIWLLAQGKTTKEIQEFTGYCLAWICTIAHRYNPGGPQALGARRQSNPGGSFLLSPEQQAQLEQALETPAPDGGLWTGRQVAPWMVAQTGRRSIPSGAGNSSSGWATASGSCVRATPRPIQ